MPHGIGEAPLMLALMTRFGGRESVWLAVGILHLFFCVWLGYLSLFFRVLSISRSLCNHSF
ncbi:hypothetical protein B0H12DRAFT_1126939, partial [Mycena haematopus]